MHKNILLIREDRMKKYNLKLHNRIKSRDFSFLCDK